MQFCSYLNTGINRIICALNMALLVFNYDNYVRGHAKCPVMTDVLRHRKSVLSLAGFTRDTKSVFKRKRNCFVPFSKRFAPTNRFRIVIARPHYNTVSVLKRFYTLSAHAQMDSTHAHFNTSAREISAILDSLLLGVVVV